MAEQFDTDLASVETVYRRSLRVVIIAQIFGGAGLAAGITVGALLAEEMLGGTSVAGLPIALFTLGSALAAYVVGRISQRAGRRVGLTAGFAAGAVGSLGIVAAATLDSPVLLFPSLLIYGAGTATNLQARYAGTDLASPEQRGTAVSMALVATTFGAVAGPLLVEATGGFAEALGAPRLSGPFMLAALAYGLAGLVLFVMLRPDPYLLSLQVSRDDSPDPVRDVTPVGVQRGVVAGATTMVVTQFVMVALMTMTPVHMRGHAHGLTAVGVVIALHVAAMYLPSLVTGRLVDRVGRTPMAVAAAATLLSAGVVAAFASGDSLAVIAIALVLLGLGWNFGLISGTAMIVDATPTATRAKTQGTVDVLIALSGAAGGALSGVIVGLSSFATLSLVGALLAFLVVPALPRSRPIRQIR